MGHRLLGVFVPDEVVDDGAEVVAQFTRRLMKPFHEDYLVEPYRVYFTPAQVKKLARYHGVPADDLPRLAAAVDTECGSPDMAVGDGDELIAVRTLSAGVDENGLYCVSVYNSDARYDWYAIGGRFYGLVTGMVAKNHPSVFTPLPHPRPDGVIGHIDMDALAERAAWLRDHVDEQVEANIAPVTDVLKRVRTTPRLRFYDFLSPECEWYAHDIDYSLEEDAWKNAARPWNVRHLRRFRQGHHVLGIDCHH